MIGHGEAERGDAHAIEHGAEGVVAEAVRVPLREDDYGLFGALGIFVGRGGIPASIDEIVFRVG